MDSSSASYVGSKNLPPHQSNIESQPSTCKGLGFVILMIVGIGGLFVVGGGGVTGYLQVGPFSNLEQVHAFILMGVGGGGGIVFLIAGIVGSVKNCGKRENIEFQPQKREMPTPSLSPHRPTPPTSTVPQEKSPFQVVYTISRPLQSQSPSLEEVIRAIPDSDTFIKIRKCPKNPDREAYEIGHTPPEIRALCNLYPQLDPYFFNGRRMNLAHPARAYNSEAGFYGWRSFNAGTILQSLKEQYEKLPSLPQAYPPLTQCFQEIKDIFSALLQEAPGICIGEWTHSDTSPGKILTENMQHLYAQGVRTLFLEHCCFDTIQSQLDAFYETGVYSPFLKKFLETGCGAVVEKNNYFEVVAAAVAAGIRPVGIERSDTQDIGYESLGGSQGPKRMLGLNLPAKEIIERESGEGKYVVWVGAAHSSYSYNIAGISELCQIPSVVMGDLKSAKEMLSFKGQSGITTNLKNLGCREPQQVEKIFKNNPENTYTTHVLVISAP